MGLHPVADKQVQQPSDHADDDGSPERRPEPAHQERYAQPPRDPAGCNMSRLRWPVAGRGYRLRRRGGRNPICPLTEPRSPKATGSRSNNRDGVTRRSQPASVPRSGRGPGWSGGVGSVAKPAERNPADPAPGSWPWPARYCRCYASPLRLRWRNGSAKRRPSRDRLPPERPWLGEPAPRVRIPPDRPSNHPVITEPSNHRAHRGRRRAWASVTCSTRRRTR